MKWKARERELATFDENRQAVGMLNPMRDKNEGTYRGRRGRHLSPRLVQKMAEVKNLLRVELERKNGYKKKRVRHHALYVFVSPGNFLFFAPLRPVLTQGLPVPGNSVSSVHHPYPYPELL